MDERFGEHFVLEPRGIILSSSPRRLHLVDMALLVRRQFFSLRVNSWCRHPLFPGVKIVGILKQSEKNLGLGIRGEVPSRLSCYPSFRVHC
jgi:hypothetical protein